METKTRIILARPADWRNRFKSYSVLINGSVAGSVKNGSAEEFSVQPGNNSIQCDMGWYKSKPYMVELKEGETAYLRVSFSMKLFWPLYIALLAGVILLFYFNNKQEKPVWIVPVAWAIIAPGFLYNLYYSTFGRKQYLVIGKDTKNVFA